jgi:hypothetical protein
VEGAQPLQELARSGALALSLRWRLPAAPDPDILRAAARLCGSHPGPTPVYIEWNDGNGESVRLRSRNLRVALEQDLLHGLRELLGPDAIHYARAN